MPRRTKHYGNCPYCGEYDKLTKDHVIPKCLFPDDKTLPTDIPKVYACKECNNIVKSANDTYFRDFLMMDLDSYQHPVPQQLFPKFFRSALRNKSEFANDFMQSQQIIELFTPSGVFAQRVYTSERVNQRSTSILTMMVRGLYYAYIEQPLPRNTTFVTFSIRDSDKLQADIRMLYDVGGKYAKVGDGDVFKCVYAYEPTHPEISLWFLCFYNRVFFGVITNRSIADAKRRTLTISSSFAMNK